MTEGYYHCQASKLPESWQLLSNSRTSGENVRLETFCSLLLGPSTNFHVVSSIHEVVK